MIDVKQGVGRRIKAFTPKGRRGAAGVQIGSRRRVRCVKRWSAAVAAALISASGGCSTVIVSDRSGQSPIAAVEREALSRAAAAVAETPWPRKPQASLAEQLAGAGGRTLGEQDLAQRFVDGLDAPRKPIVLAAALANIEAAQHLAAAGDAALTAIRPAMSDVAILESAIADLKENRDVYVASLKLIARGGEPVDGDELRRLRAEFSNVIGDLGQVADALADRTNDDVTRTFAIPAASRFVN